MGENLLKVHGSGNTFYLYETKDEASMDWFKFGEWLCRESNDGGADGLLLVAPSDVATAKMRVINADGSEASMCGNGLRCVARYVLEREGVDECIIETMKANLLVTREPSLMNDVPTYAVEIAPVSFDLTSLPMQYNAQTTLIDECIPTFSTDIRFTAVSVPNPHLIGLVPKEMITSKQHQQQLATMLNGENDYTPDGVNVSYMYPLGEQEIYVRTFERGVGFTNACGTAMTASALVATLLHLVGEGTITVFNPGGFVKCEVQNDNGDYRLRLIGNATFTAHYTFTPQQDEWVLQKLEDTKEQQAYEALVDYTASKLAVFA
ncbi:diaminopimelate epimerase [Kurthia massiliensis]|uniref:diaminopimelate epimerase n=1 Tax=Kurthia massiliensis TaxID=1033739 RepID=UPI000288E195|nr:diaminopimelate epimerase [Kurthia massiliensis]